MDHQKFDDKFHKLYNNGFEEGGNASLVINGEKWSLTYMLLFVLGRSANADLFQQT
jgi:hypothetical protein